MTQRDAIAGGARRGRRNRNPGSADSRDAILAAAGRLFAEHGYDGTSLRQIAREAGLDPAMVHHFFKGKEELFAQCVALPADPAEVLRGVGEQDPGMRAEAVVRAVVRLWESPAQRSLIAFIRGTIGSRTRTVLLRQTVTRTVLSRVMSGVPGSPEEVALRGNLVASQMVGLMMARYVVRLEPLASLSPEEVVALLSPTIQRYMTGELPTAAQQ